MSSFLALLLQEAPIRFVEPHHLLNWGVYELLENQRETGSQYDPNVYDDDSTMYEGNKKYGLTGDQLRRFMQVVQSIVDVSEQRALAQEGGDSTQISAAILAERTATIEETNIRWQLLGQAKRAKCLKDTNRNHHTNR